MSLLTLGLKLIISTLIVFGCKPVGGATACTDDTECSLAEACQNGVCTDPCKTIHCSDPNSVCINLEHKTKCVCNNGFVIVKNHCKPENSSISPIEFVQCTDNAQCKLTEACQNGFCTETCMDAECKDPNEVCVIVYPKRRCVCKYGFALGEGGCKPVHGGRSAEESISKTRFEFVDIELAWENARLYCIQEGMKLATVENTGKKLELERFIQKIGNKELKTPQSSYYVFYPLPSRRFKFKLKATIGEGHLAFSKINKFSEDPIVQLSLGSFQNKRLILKKNHYEPYTWEKEIPNLVSTEEFRGFWVDFGRTYRLGMEKEETPLMTWEDPEPFYVNHFGIHSGWGSSAVWSFYGETVTTNADQKNNLYYYTRLPQFSLDITVRANEGVQIALTGGPQDISPMYEIILGGWGNTASAIRYQQADKVKVDTPGLLSASEVRRFRIRWKDGVVTVVNRYGEMVMKWHNKEYVEITHYGLMSPRGEASWSVVVTDDINGLATTGRLWLGGAQLRGAGQFKWLGSGQAVTSDWYTGKINKGFTRAEEYTGHCLSTAPMVFGRNGALNNLQWFKATCFTEFKFICERT